MNTTSRTHTSTSIADRLTTTPPAWLRPVVALDAVVSGVNGLVYLLAASYLADLLGPAAGLLMGLGGFLLVWAAVLGAVASRNPLPATIVREIGYLNLAWVAGSVAAAAGLLGLTGVGLAWCLLQAVVVLGFAAAQVAGTRR